VCTWSSSVLATLEVGQILSIKPGSTRGASMDSLGCRSPCSATSPQICMSCCRATFQRRPTRGFRHWTSWSAKGAATSKSPPGACGKLRSLWRKMSQSAAQFPDPDIQPRLPASGCCGRSPGSVSRETGLVFVDAACTFSDLLHCRPCSVAPFGCVQGTTSFLLCQVSKARPRHPDSSVRGWHIRVLFIPQGKSPVGHVLWSFPQAPAEPCAWPLASTASDALLRKRMQGKWLDAQKGSNRTPAPATLAHCPAARLSPADL